MRRGPVVCHRLRIARMDLPNWTAADWVANVALFGAALSVLLIILYRWFR